MYNFDLIAINETRLDETIANSQVILEDYQVIRKDRLRHAGGVCVYIKNSVQFKVRSDKVPDGIEALCIETLNINSRSFYVIGCYRPPSSDVSFFSSLESIILKLDDEDKEILVIGDLNCNMAATTPDFYTKQLNSIIEVYQLQQLILEPTRVTDKSKTLIDIILTNNPARLTFSGVCHTGISDHSLGFGIRKISGNTNIYI